MQSNIIKTKPVHSLTKKTLTLAVGAITAAVLTAQPYTPVLAKQGENLTKNVLMQNQLPGSFADLVETVKPAVVNISIASTASGQFGRSPRFNFPPGSDMEQFFKRFFEQGPQNRNDRNGGGDTEHEMRSLGSGFIVDPNGFVVTNNHVIDNANEIMVILDDGTELDAKLIGTDPKTDLALLKVESDRALPHVSFGDSDSARIGDWVIAIGNPFGLGGTTTKGIISARGRDLNAGPLDDFIQVDAPINRGNSGGPLFNMRGEVIGVNTAIYSPSGGSVGIGFAIPTSIAQTVINQLTDTGMVSRGWLGVHIQALTQEIAEGLELADEKGALVTKVMGDSPAEAAGLAAGDVIRSFNGKTVSKLKDLPRLVANTPADTEVVIEILRDGNSKILSTTIAASDNEQKILARADKKTKEKANLGLALAPLSRDTLARYQLDETTTGVVIVDVAQDSPAARKGLVAGDVIVKVGKTTVGAPEDVIEAVNRAQKENGKAVLLLINRKGNERFVALRFA